MNRAAWECIGAAPAGSRTRLHVTALWPVWALAPAIAVQLLHEVKKVAGAARWGGGGRVALRVLQRWLLLLFAKLALEKLEPLLQHPDLLKRTLHFKSNWWEHMWHAGWVSRRGGES